MNKRERLAWGALIAFALVLRLAALGARPPHHDESIHCDFAYNLLNQGTYRYDPTYHGPLIYYVMAPLFLVLGASTAVGRLYPALAGVALVALPLMLRRRLGAGAAWWSGLVLAISPIMLYYSRFAREDVPVAFFTSLALALFLLVRRKGWKTIPWIGVAASGHAMMKETFYVTAPLLCFSVYIVALRDGVWANVRRGFAWVDRYRVPVGTAFLWFFAITVTAFTVFFVHPEDWAFPIKAVSYWYSQHHVQRVGGPWFYHLPRLALYEFLPIAAALAWAIRRGRRMKRLEVFCLAWGLSSVAMYAYLGEKVPWLAVHQVLPFVPLAGAQLSRTFSSRGRRWSQSLAVIGLVATAWSALASSFLHPAVTTSDRHAELIVFVQTTPEEQALAEYGRALAATHGEGMVAAVDGEASWPLSWQWKKIPVWWATPQAGMHPLLVVCDPDKEGSVRELLGDGYTTRRIPLRAWWVEEMGGSKFSDMVGWFFTPRGLSATAEWFFTRRAWSPIGATDVLVFESGKK
ncbi:MAG: TIGR03663 family protein [Acidobacteriia bacterium]|nr:TIGR03663 family protein [Terriglobia bacterium]